VTAYILNLIDLFFTLHAIRNGATELNPLLQSVPVMVAVKVVGVGFLCCLLHVFATDNRVGRKAKKLARWGLRICAAVFAAVDLYHLINLF
jgi:tellurite resistance protein TehA-like permease